MVSTGGDAAPGDRALQPARAAQEPRVVFMGMPGTGAAAVLMQPSAASSRAVGVPAALRFERAMAPGKSVSALPAGTEPRAAGSDLPQQAQAQGVPGKDEVAQLAGIEVRPSSLPGLMQGGGQLSRQLGSSAPAAAARAGNGDGVAPAQSPMASRSPGSIAGNGGGQSVAAPATPLAASGVGDSASHQQQLAATQAGVRVEGGIACLPGLEVDAVQMLCHVPQTRLGQSALLAKAAGLDELPSFLSGNRALLYAPIVPGGRLKLRLHILADGSVGEVLVREPSGSSELDKETLWQAWRFRFTKPLKDGRAVDAWVDLPVTYRKSGPFFKD